MKDAFIRALIGFTVLTIAITGMALIALWALATFSPPDGGLWWASLLVVLLAMVTEIMIFGSTLQEPISDWIKQPKRERERAEADERHRKRMEEIAAEEAAKGSKTFTVDVEEFEIGRSPESGPKSPPPPKPKR